MRQTPHSNILAGWREWVRLPGIDVAWIKAKLDTGAQTSSLHAFDPEEFTRDGAEWVRFTVRPWQESDLDGHVVELPVHDRRRVKSSNGQVQERIVVRMNLVLIGHEVDAEVTLSNRDQMGFRMLVGREALQQGFVVDSGRSFVGERPPRSIRNRNNGE